MSASSSETQMKIYVKNNDINKALRILKKKMLAEGIMKEARENEFFRSKGEKKRLAEKAGKKRWEKKRLQLEQKFIREERNQIRNSRKKNNKRKFSK
jgi:small subunit ribosomal protein S21